MRNAFRWFAGLILDSLGIILVVVSALAVVVIVGGVLIALVGWAMS